MARTKSVPEGLVPLQSPQLQQASHRFEQCRVVPQDGDEDAEAQLNVLHNSEEADTSDDARNDDLDDTHIDALTAQPDNAGASSPNVDVELSEEDGCSGEDAVTAFALDPDFDYDNVDLTENPMAKLRQEWMEQHTAANNANKQNSSPDA
eukprot:2445443-Pyramimonas_sp.AAC.1